jgi:hypothetical protein
MEIEGPPLESLTRRLAECPPEFLDEPYIKVTNKKTKGRVLVSAVVNDLIVELGGSSLTPAQLEQYSTAYDIPRTRNRLKLILIGCWLLHDPWFRQQNALAQTAYDLLATGLDELADLTTARKFITEPDRREELARLCLKALNFRPAGETEAQAQDRLATLNTAERQRVIKAAREAEERAQQIREAMARKAAEEAADKAGRE